VGRWARTGIHAGGMIVLGFGAAWALCLGMLGKSRAGAVQSRILPQAVPGAPMAVVINEVAWMGTAYSDWDEWIELYNNTDSEIDLAGWTLTSTGSVSILLSGRIPARGYFLLEREDRAVADLTADQVYGGQRLINDGEMLVLRNGLGDVADTANAGLGHGAGWAGGTNNPERTMERIAPAAADTTGNWVTHDGDERNGVDAAGAPIDGTPGARNASYASQGLSVRAAGPAATSPGTEVEAYILLGNTAAAPISGTVVTEVLPAEMSFVSQSSPFAFDRPATDTLVWRVGTLLPGAAQPITVVLRSSELASGVLAHAVTATDDSGRVETAVWSVSLIPHVRIYALHPYALRSEDEGLALVNLGRTPVELGGWGISDGDAVPDARLPATVLPPGGVLWIADQADAFLTSFGFAPDLAVSHMTHAVPLLSGVWPGFANSGDQAVLYENAGRAVDVLVYGEGLPGPEGWLGRAVAYPRPGFSGGGQIIYRKLDEHTGLPLPDTDRAMDWANDTASGSALYGPVHEGDLFGKRVAYPGWAWDAYTQTLTISGSAALTVAVTPDNAYGVVAGLLGGARHSILIEGYSFESVWFTRILTERLAAGVQVTMLLEGGEISDLELWNCAQIVQAGGRVAFMHNDSSAKIYDRYVNQHAKFIVVDGTQVAVSSENFSNRAFPVDDKANGTAGRRGVVLVTDQPQVVAHVTALLLRDNDPARYNDIVAYGAIPRYTVPVTYTAVFSTGGGGYVYMAPFSETVPAFQGDRFAVTHAPETSLRYTDGLIGLVLRAGAGDEVYVEQMYERLHWGPASSSVITDPNPRLEAYIQAARQGARVRILLDNAFDDERKNVETAIYALSAAQAEGLDLDVRLGNPTCGGLHNKMVLVSLGGERTIHVGSTNGSEVSSKGNREVSLQVRSSDAYAYLKQVWDYDWMHSGGPHEAFFPFAMRGRVPASDHVLVSEVMFKQAGSGDEVGEWIELYNPTAAPVDVGGWLLGDATDAKDYERLYAFPAGTTIAAQGTLVVARRATAYASLGYATQPLPDFEWNHSSSVPDMVRTDWGDGECALGNLGDEVLLLDAARRVVDVLVYGTGSYPGVRSFAEVDGVYNGNSLERRPANRDSNDCVRDFWVRYTPDPGHVAAW
jgi:uncharacterized repeat protein (TIGR01451 family)